MIKGAENLLGWTLDEDGIVIQGSGHGVIAGPDPASLEVSHSLTLWSLRKGPKCKGQLKRVWSEQGDLENLDRLQLPNGETVWIRLCGAPSGNTYRLQAFHIDDWKGTELRSVIDLLPVLF